MVLPPPTCGARGAFYPVWGCFELSARKLYTTLRPDPLIFASRFLVGRVRRPLDAQMPEVVETDSDRAVALTECRVEIHTQAGDVGAFDRGCGTGRQRHEALLRFRQRAGG